jgi:hypothetical protein
MLPAPITASEVLPVWLQHEPQSSPEQTLCEVAEASLATRLLVHLTPMEAKILRWRFGLEGEEELTLKEIGAKYNLGGERIRSMQNDALGKLRGKWPAEFCESVMTREEGERRARQATSWWHQEREREREQEAKDREYHDALAYLLAKKSRREAAEAWLAEATRAGLVVFLEDGVNVRYCPEDKMTRELLNALYTILSAVAGLLRERARPPRARVAVDEFEEAASRGLIP